MKMKTIKYLTLCLMIVGVMSCSPSGGEDRGHEYMPDMAHSVAYEANSYNYYGLNTYSDEISYKEYAMPREPVPGTVSRGAAGLSMRSPEDAARLMNTFNGLTQVNEISIPINGSVAYPYADTEEERTRAADELTQNALPITEEGLAQGKDLYVIYCGICHGSKGAGDGHLARENGPYPAVPANLLEAKFRETTDGLFYHAIMRGKNVMGAYSDKLSYEERWNVIHYVRSLQAKEQKLAYSAEENTLNGNMTGASYFASFETPEVHNNDIFSLGGDHGDHDSHGRDHDEHQEDSHGDEDNDDNHKDSHGDEDHDKHDH